MVSLEVIFSVMIGGALTLLGTLLANYLQYRSEKRELRKERAKERFMEVRRYLTACLQFADLVSIPTALRPDEFDPATAKEFLELVSDQLDEWKSLPVRGSARVIFVEDKEILQWLQQIDSLRAQFSLNYQSLIHKRAMINLDDKREELRQLSARVAERLDELLDQI